MRLGPLALLLLMPGCLSVGADDAPAPRRGCEGCGGATGPTCEEEPEQFCEGLACGAVSECGEPCLQTCLRWTPLPLQGERPPPLVSAALHCGASGGWLFGGERRVAPPDLPEGACGTDPRVVTASDELWRLVPGEIEARWERLDAPGGGPSRRAAAALLPVGPDAFVIFGGVRAERDERGCDLPVEALGDAWLFRDGAWSALEGALPSPRFSAWVATDPATGASVLAGGATAKLAGGDLAVARDAWRFDPAALRFEQLVLDIRPDEPDDRRLPVFGAAVWIEPHGLVALGGREATLTLEDRARVYHREAHGLSPTAGATMAELAELRMPWDGELFGAAWVPGVGLLAHRGYAGALGHDPTTSRWDAEFGWRPLTGPGTGLDAGAPGEISSYAFARCDALGGVLLFGGELGGEVATSSTWRLATPPPP